MGEWLKRWQWLLPLVALLAAVASGLENLLRLFDRSWAEKVLRFATVFPYLSQLLGIAALLFISARQPKTSAKFPEDSRIVERFHKTWCALWAAWTVMYLALTLLAIFRVLGKLPVEATAVETVVFDGFGNVVNLFMFLCFLTLYRGHRAGNLEWLPWTMVLVVFLSIEVLLTITDGKFPEPLAWISGFTGSVTLALVVGRLDSRLISAPIGIIAALYLYAAMQLTSASFFTPERSLQKLLTVTAALPLKLILFFVVQSALESGILLYYVHELRALDKQVDGPRSEFLRNL